MEYTELIDRFAAEAAATRVAALAAGPDTKVPSCPDWTVQRLATHLAAVYTWAMAALRVAPDEPAPGRQPRPEINTFEDAIGWWDTALQAMIAMLRERDADAPAWTINNDRNARFWARRMAHDTAIHRFDAELAADTAAPLVFDPVFAADGIDEFVRTMMLGAQNPYEGTLSGTVLVHAADAGRAWLIAIAPGEPFTTTEQPVITADASVVGTADAVYRAMWGRPSGAVVGGDRALLDLLAAP